MFNQDYIMRMIEQLVQGIARIMRLKQENKLEESADMLSGTLRQFYGLHTDSLNQLSWRDMMSVASFGGLPDAERCALLAQLVKEKADLDGLAGQADNAQALYLKSLNLTLAALDADPDLHTAEHRQNVGELTALTATMALPGETRELLMGYYEQEGQFGKAEDQLFLLLEDPDAGAAAVEEGLAFYRRLLEKSDGELERGNLSRDEVAEGLRTLQSR